MAETTSQGQRRPLILPAGWREERPFMVLPGVLAAVFRYRDGLVVLASEESHADGRRWLHVSCSYPNRLPSWTDLLAVKSIFIGTDKEAVQVLPRQREYVNEHEYCLHLWHCLDGDIVPPASHG